MAANGRVGEEDVEAGRELDASGTAPRPRQAPGHSRASHVGGALLHPEAGRARRGRRKTAAGGTVAIGTPPPKIK